MREPIMADDIEFSLGNWTPITNKMKNLPPNLQKRGLRRATRKAMNIVRDEARRNAPVKSGLTKRSIITVVTTSKNAVTAKVGVRGGGKKRGNNPFWWRFNELGTVKQKAKPFLGPALPAKLTEVTNKMATETSKEIDELI